MHQANPKLTMRRAERWMVRTLIFIPVATWLMSFAQKQQCHPGAWCSSGFKPLAWSLMRLVLAPQNMALPESGVSSTLSLERIGVVSQRVKMVLHIDFCLISASVDSEWQAYVVISTKCVSLLILWHSCRNNACSPLDPSTFNVSWMYRFGRLCSDSHSQDTSMVMMCSAARRRYQFYVAPRSVWKVRYMARLMNGRNGCILC